MRGILAGAAAGLSLALMAAALGEAHRPEFQTGGLPTSARRIVSLSFAFDEILLGLAPDRLIGVTRYAQDPESSNLPDVARRASAIHRVGDVEALVEMQPDLLVADEFNSADSVMLLRRAGLAVFGLRMPRSIDDIRRNLAALGEAVREPGRAAEMIAEIDRARTEVRERVRGRTRPRVLGISYGMWANSGGTIVDDLIREGGGQNVVPEPLRRGGFEISLEEAMELDPDVVVAGGDPGWAGHPLEGRLRARVVVLPMRVAHPPSQFIARAILAWGRAIHPEAFP